MSLRRRGVVVLLVAVGASIALPKAPALAADGTPDKERCAVAYEQAQRLRKRAHFTEARRELVVCLDPSCTPSLRNDCSTWLDEIDASMPSIVPKARDSGGTDVAAAIVRVDETAPVPIDGRAIELDPGAHVLVFSERGDHGRSTRVDVVVGEGEKNRTIIGTFAVREPREPGKDVPRPHPRPSRLHEPWPWIFGGVTVVALGSFGAFGIDGSKRQSDLEKSCSPHCGRDDIQSVKTRFLVADISLVVALVAGGATAWSVLR